MICRVRKLPAARLRSQRLRLEHPSAVPRKEEQLTGVEAPSRPAGDQSAMPNESLPHATAAHAVFVAAPPRLASPLFRYAMAIALPGLALLASALLERLIAPVLFIFFWPAVLVTAALGGWQPGLLASLISVVAVDFFFMEPRHSLNLADPAAIFPMTMFA